MSKITRFNINKYKEGIYEDRNGDYCQYRQVEKMEKAIEYLKDKACSCDAMIGYQCGIHKEVNKILKGIEKVFLL